MDACHNSMELMLYVKILSYLYIKKLTIFLFIYKNIVLHNIILLKVIFIHLFLLSILLFDFNYNF